MGKTEITAHLKKFDKPQRDALASTRLILAEFLPKADEVIKYGIPTFVMNGRGVIGFDGFKKHNSIFPYIGALIPLLAPDLEKYETTKGAIHFDLFKPMPRSLLKKIVRVRLEILEESGK